MKQSILFLTVILFFACKEQQQNSNQSPLNERIEWAYQQIKNAAAAATENGQFRNPVTLRPDSSVFYCGYSDWRSGFFPGSLWYLYELTEDTSILSLAKSYTLSIEEAKNLTWHHDVGFMVGNSFGNGLRLTGEPYYRNAIIQAAKSLSTRFHKNAGILQSWNVSGWMAERGWQCPVIVDNMMNLELLFEATRLSGDSSFYKIAVSHADRTLKEQFRPNGSAFHVLDYDTITGEIRGRYTAQGYADSSAWSRGQAWAIYGFAVAFRETGDRKYLAQSLKTFDFMKNHPNMPQDLVPYWDMDAPNIPDEPRDASSAAIMASALYEISTMPVENADGYRNHADSIVNTLSSPAYRAESGANDNFILMHSVGSLPGNAEVDKPLNYADYYYIEALKRKKELEK
ncbi:MAG: glycoside hydrolase family 88 protein [Tannerella sp.]|jgi:rhamnogalacturonyl hydrolase YesR|nr:glycoside hydrolase family 88 protein [Tannerella sp.]